MNIPDLSTVTYHDRSSSHVTYLSVGWLGNSVPTTGGVPPNLLEKLRVAHIECQLFCGCFGGHACEICAVFNSEGEFFVEHGRVRYLFPNMLFHYIESHDYGLPEPVIQALTEWNENPWRDHMVSPDVDRTVRLLFGRLIHADGDTLHVQLLHGGPELGPEFFHLMAPAFPWLKRFHIKLE